MKLTVSEGLTKAMRVWEELGGPRYLSLPDAIEVFRQMTPAEQREIPTWPRVKDPPQLPPYVLPRRLQRKPRA